MRLKTALKISVAAVSVLALLIFLALRINSTGTYERTFDASSAKLWQVWNDPAAIKKWWGPKGYTAPVIRNDPRAGGTYLWSMKSPAGVMSWTTGVFKEVVPNTRLVCTMSFSDANGKAIPGSKVPIPGHWPDAILITTEFTELHGQTKVTVTEAGIPLLVKFVSKIAWRQQFDKIQSLL